MENKIPGFDEVLAGAKPSGRGSEMRHRQRGTTGREFWGIVVDAYQETRRAWKPHRARGGPAVSDMKDERAAEVRRIAVQMDYERERAQIESYRGEGAPIRELRLSVLAHQMEAATTR